jgi:hypothetical protein
MPVTQLCWPVTLTVALPLRKQLELSSPRIINLETVMKISVLLNHVTQEQVGKDDDIAFVGWLHVPAGGPDAGNFLQSDEGGSKFGTRALPRLSARKEEWGGVVVHGPSMIVFQVDNEGHQVFERLIAGVPLDEALKSFPASPDVDAFREFLQVNELA